MSSFTLQRIKRGQFAKHIFTGAQTLFGGQLIDRIEQSFQTGCIFCIRHLQHSIKLPPFSRQQNLLIAGLNCANLALTLAGRRGIVRPN